MRNQLRRYGRNVLFVSAPFCFAWLAVADLQDEGFQGAFKFFEVDQASGTAAFVTEDEQAQYLVVGFESEPLLFEVSDERHPLEVDGFEYLTPAGGADPAAYFIYENEGVFVAAEAEKVHSIPSIQRVP